MMFLNRAKKIILLHKSNNTKMKTKKDYLKETIQHIDIKKHNVVSLVEDMNNMAFSSRDLAIAANYFDMMLADKGCSVMLCLAGSLFFRRTKECCG